jgi:hypothetical protein
MSPKFVLRPRLGWKGQRRAPQPNKLAEELKLRYGFMVSRLGSVTPPNYEEKRALEQHKIEVDRQRALTAMYIQRRMTH